MIKIGGSLLDYPALPRELQRVVKPMTLRGDRVILIAGGGPGADWIRSLDAIYQLGEECSHALALHALDLSAFALAHIVNAHTNGERCAAAETLEQCEDIWTSGCIPVLAPRRLLERHDELHTDNALPHHWNVTTDSIAAWIAVRLQARLILLKSTALPRDADRDAAASQGIVDLHFPIVARKLKEITYIHLRDPHAVPVIF